MHAETILSICHWFIAAWLGAVAVFALVSAGSAKFDPLPPELPEHHHDDDHGDHGHGGHGHDDHGHHGHGGHGH